MQGKQFYEELNEKSIEIILNFKPNEKHDKSAVNELQSLRDKVKKAISFLPDVEKKIVELRYFRNLNKDVISTQLGRNREEIGNVLGNAIKSIKRNLKEAKTDIPTQGFKKPDEPKMIPGQSPGTVSRWSVIVILMIFMVIFAFTFWVVYLFVTNITKPEVLSQIGTAFNNLGSQVQFEGNKTAKKTVRPVSADSLRISGSTSLLTLSKKWKNAFILDYPKYKVSLIKSEDSDSGIKALITGDVEVANSSRPVSHQDQKKANQNGIELVENRVALDALVIAVNAVNPVKDLSLEDLEKIFNGEVQNWQDISSFNKPLAPVIREKGSGTNDFVLSRILQNTDFPGEPVRKKSNKEIFDFISQSEGAIAFINSNNFPWGNKKIKYMKIKTYPDSVSVAPFIGHKLNENAVRYGDYPLAHYLYLITAVDRSESISDFIDWVLSEKGQNIVKNAGLLPVRTDEE